MNNNQLEHISFLAAKSKNRNTAIDLLVASATAAGDCVDRMYWTLIHDFEHAPMTTNLQQLAEIGITVQPTASLSDDELPPALETVITQLARLGVYLINTNHLSDNTLYEQLVASILTEPIRDLPPTTDVVEWIDLTACRGKDKDVICDRDATLPRPANHPLLPQAHTDGNVSPTECTGKPILSTICLRPPRKARKKRSTNV